MLLRRAILVLTILLSGAPAGASDPAWNWTGPYFGAHVGGFTGTTTFSNPEGPSIFGDVVTTPGFIAGLQLGYNFQVSPRWVTGIQLDGSILSSQGQNSCLQATAIFVGANCKSMPREIATLTGRLGYLTEPQGRTLLFGRAGVARMRTQIEVGAGNPSSTGFTLTGDPADVGDPVSRSVGSWGWTIGAGVEYAIAPRWSVSLGYDYLQFSGMNVGSPQTVEITTAGNVTTVPGGALLNVNQAMHVARIGVNHHWGGLQAASPQEPEERQPWTRHWQFEAGARYWYSWGNFETSNGTATSLVSRLPYNNMEGHSGELFARLDSPFGVFAKGFVGGGGITRGTMYDEDWGLGSDLADQPTGYEITQSGVNGSFSYLTADIGYNVMRGPNHKVGLFLGYNRYQVLMNTQGCAQLVAPSSGVCSPDIPADVNAITEFDTWHSLRVGASVEVEFSDRLRLGADLAFLPMVHVDALDIHRLRNLSFPAAGRGYGVQAEIMLSYRLFDAASIGMGGRYWSMWTATAQQVDAPANIMTLSTDRYGVFVQASYKFN